PTWDGRHADADAFADIHPTKSFVEVYHDPQHPERAVLVPGADEDTNRISIWCGSIIFALTLYLVIRSWPIFARAIAKTKAAEARHQHTHEHRIPGLPNAFVSYEPGDRRKLNCFPDEGCLHEVLGQIGKKIQDWKPDDRVIDSMGQEYRL